MKEPVVSAQGTDRTGSELTDSAAGWKILFLLGVGIAVVGTIDVALLFFPPRWSSLDWEFGTLNAVLQSLPLMTFGIGTLCAAAVANGWVRARRVASGIVLLMTLLILIMTAMYVLDTFAVLKAVQPALKPTVKLTAIRSCLMLFTYFVLYLALGVWTWRRLRATKGPRG